MKTQIGLDKKQSEKLAKELNELLADYQIFYMNVRGYHWNIRGINFFELHAKFEEVYDDLVIKVDEIAERILTLGYRPSNAFSEYLKIADIKEHTGVSSAKDCLQGTLEGFKALLSKQRAILETASDVGDEGTASQMSDYITEQEKLIWMYSAACESCNA